MQEVKKKQSEVLITRKIKFESASAMNCLQAREKLDELLSGELRLEETHPAVKRLLFGHLEICEQCCRAFDVRVHFRPGGRDHLF